jgi:hypothetical protein
MHFALGEIAKVADGALRSAAEWKRGVVLAAVAIDQNMRQVCLADADIPHPIQPALPGVGVAAGARDEVD